MEANRLVHERPYDDNYLPERAKPTNKLIGTPKLRAFLKGRIEKLYSNLDTFFSDNLIISEQDQVNLLLEHGIYPTDRDLIRKLEPGLRLSRGSLLAYFEFYKS